MITSKEYMVTTLALMFVGVLFHTGGLVEPIFRYLGFGVNVFQVIWLVIFPMIVKD